MAEPSWLPSTWPTDAPDIEDNYKRMAPRQWPQRLYDEDGEAFLDQTAVGHVYSWVRKMVWWVMDRYHPSYDTDTSPYLLHLWEALFGLASSQNITERIYNVVASIRHRGTGIDDLIKSIFTAIFGVPDDSTQVSMASPDPADVWSALQWQKTNYPYDVTWDCWGVHTLDYDNVWICGTGGTIYKGAQGGAGYDLADFTWTSQASGTANALYGIYAYSTTYAWSVGLVSAVREYDGVSWNLGPIGFTLADYYSVWMTGKYWDTVDSEYKPEHVWIAGSNNAVCRYDVRNTSWTNYMLLGTGATITYDVHALSHDKALACQANGDVWYWDGSSWTYTVPAVQIWTACRIVMDGTDEIHWVVGSNGKTYRRINMGSWTDESPATSILWYDLDGWQENRLVAVGQNGTCMEYDGSAWVAINANQWTNINCISICRSSVFAFTGGDNGWMLRNPNTDTAATDYAWNQLQMHIYSTGQDLDPDYGLGRDKLNLVQPTQQHWSIGRRRTLRASDSNDASGAGNACAS